MAVTVEIPAALRRFVGEQRTIEVQGRTVGEALADLAGRYQSIRPHLFEAGGELRSFVNVYLGDRDVRRLGGDATPLEDGATLMLVPSIAGGLITLEAAASELPKLTQQEILRYSRHLILPEVGVEGQRKLKASRVLLVGAGGLGSPLGLYLAAAGVGRLGLVDYDVVELSNLQRQIIHSTDAVGRPKLESAAARIRGINPGVEVVQHEARLTSENAMEILAGYDVVVDGSDNFPTRYLVNDACVLLGKPNVYGSIFRFEGQASVFWAERGPCYRCLYRDPPPPELVPSCAEGGVLGVLPGIVGTIQAVEAIKLLLGTGQPLIGRLLLFDALRMQFRELVLEKDPECPICGRHPSLDRLIDYEAFCGVAPRHGEPAHELEIMAKDVAAALGAGRKLQLVDVREPWEFEICHLPGSTLIPLGHLPSRTAEIDPSAEVVTYCHTGRRSLHAAEFLKGIGVPKVRSMKGGVEAWAVEVDPTMARY